MIKNNRKGFVLAETLVVTVFLMWIFTMIYTNFYPLMGEYEKRETYDDVDGKYDVFWLKRMIEDSSYQISVDKIVNLAERGYARFECDDVASDDEKREICKNMVKALQVEGCDKRGNNCEIFITPYRIGNGNDKSGDVWFKKTVKLDDYKNYNENCFSGNCKQLYINKCLATEGATETTLCTNRAEKNVFRSGFKDYVYGLPDYKIESLNYAKYRVIACFHHKKDNNNYYSYATMEVNK